jgi:hypothetical protein
VTAVDPRKERIAKNEAIFRAVNEVLRDPEDGQLEVTCECGDRECEQILLVPVQVYERTRSDSARFIVVPGHAMPDVEDLIEHTDSYDIVRKHEDAAQIAEELDPRGD